ncbi:hypothetical protein JW921_06820 [Candidatus Fermentibacterales bacterium]|nr:hypothetical protein [Candidatus Fermentibacterales bacterium]
MAQGAYLLISVQAGTELAVQSKLHQMECLKHSGVVTGMYDIICYVEDENLETLKQDIYKIRKTDFITSTITCFAFNIGS